jgi:hypothetical protein
MLQTQTIDAVERHWRGIQPPLLIAQVKNTAKWLFQFDVFEGDKFLEILRKFDSPQSPVYLDQVSRAEYFRLCIAAHFATVATLVPTDLDQTIRIKLWQDASKTETQQMVEAIFEFLTWSEKKISRRWLTSPESKIHLSGHLGEWFSIALPAWNACRVHNLSSEIDRLETEILNQLSLQNNCFKELIAHKADLEMLKASTLIAHNLGDLDRVVDLWSIPKDNSFIKKVYNLGHQPNSVFQELSYAGALNKFAMATENHRHYPLRDARDLRLSEDFLVGIGPFFDSWGKILSRHPLMSISAIGDITSILIDAWVKQNQRQEVYGYARALAGIQSSVPGGLQTLLSEIPASRRKILSTGPLRKMIDRSQDEFEASFSNRCKKFMATCVRRMI